MRWSIIRLIWHRELRDQLRDRRTLFMIVVLPLVLYPILGYAVLQFAFSFNERSSVIAFVTGPCEKGNFPPRSPGYAGRSIIPYLTGIGTTPGGSVDNLVAPIGWGIADQVLLDYPYLVQSGEFTVAEPNVPPELAILLNQTRFRLEFPEALDLTLLDDGKVDLIVAAPEDFYALVEKGEVEGSAIPPLLDVYGRNDEASKQAKKRLETLLEGWKLDLKNVRFARRGLAPSFDAPFAVREPGAPAAQLVAPRLVDLIMKLFPFMLVMWSLAGALYPAIDLCAGEKERGTMETLLITPAAREEIVLGKFLTIWVFSLASALINLASMGITTMQFGSKLSMGPIPLHAILWCVVLALPMSALFSAVSLAIGAYARSSKEGQYYLMPLFLVTMPLIFLTLAPGVELTPFYSLIPVTGVALLMQKLMLAQDRVPWLYFIPVLAPIALYSWIALRWAIDQFKREDVLFREAERLDIKLWFQRVFREKEPSATLGQAYFLFGMIMLLRWLASNFGAQASHAVQHSISLLAFVAAPALLMAIMLNTKPRASLYAKWPTGRDIALAAALALLLLPPLAAAAGFVFERFPNVIQLLRDRQPLMEALWSAHAGEAPRPEQFWPFLLAFALLPALCEEIAFRGFILTGLHKRFRPRTAVLLSSFLFALYHMNVFQLLPAFLLGIVLGLVTVRSKSLLPAMLLHFLHNAALLVAMQLLPSVRGQWPFAVPSLWPVVIGVSALIAVGLLWWLYRKPYVDKEREEAALVASGSGQSR